MGWIGCCSISGDADLNRIGFVIQVANPKGTFCSLILHAE